MINENTLHINRYEAFFKNPTFLTRNTSELFFTDSKEEWDKVVMNTGTYASLSIEDEYEFLDFSVRCLKEKDYTELSDTLNAYYDIESSGYAINSDISKLETLISSNEAKLNSYQNSFKKAKQYFNNLFSNKEISKEEGDYLNLDLWDLDDNKIKELAKALSVAIDNRVKVSSGGSYSFSDLIYYERRINEVSKQLKRIKDTINYLVHLLGKVVRNKRQYYRKISSIPFKNLDDYHSYNFIGIN